MGRISLLSPAVISGIAAGEVIDRPATIIKELVENALDADATRIEIELEQAGLKKISIQDDGRGMDALDLALATTRHATSKIAQLKDLDGLNTFGFRGEALASIAAVAQLTLISRTAALPHGYKLVSQPNQPAVSVTTPQLEPIAAPLGTTIVVEDVFAHLPARLKFMKNPATELRHVLHVVTQAALMHPKVRFQLTHHHKPLLTLSPHANWQERVSAVLGQSTTRALVPLHYQEVPIQLTGFISPPGASRRQHGQQYVFVNRRPVFIAGLPQRFKAAYGRLLAAAAEPLFVLHLELPPHLVDINVHPRKEEARFTEQSQILGLVERALQHVFAQFELQPIPPDQEDREYALPQPTSPRSLPASDVTSQWIKENQPLWQLTANDSNQPGPVLQLHHTYLVTTTPTGLVLVDQHAAHERLIFDQLKQLYRQANTTRHTLAAPVVIEVSANEAALLLENITTLSKIGIELEQFGQTSFSLTTLPELLKDRNPEKLLLELVDELKTGHQVTQVDSLAERTLAYLSCRQAVKAGDYLTPEQRQELLRLLAEHPEKMTCPHGRPVAIVLTKTELEKRFGRR